MFKAERLIKRKTSTSEMDSVKQRESKLFAKNKDTALLERCAAIWYNMDDFRQQRARGHRFYDGDQWADIITVNGQKMTYRKYLMDKGNVVIQTNQIKNRVDTIAGVMTRERNEPVCHAIVREEQPYGLVVTDGLQANCNKNVISTLYNKWIKDICLGGLAVAYESYDDTTGPSRRMDSWTRYINPGTLILEAEGVDPRHWDISLIGRFFYGSFADICAQFARKPSDYAVLKDIYSSQADPFKVEATRDFSDRYLNDELVFMDSSDPTRCYVCEVWTKETRPMIRLHDTDTGKEEIISATDTAYRRAVRQENENRRRLAKAAGWLDDGEVPYIIGDGFGKDETEKNGFFVETYWYCKFIAPDGTVLWEGESPYADKSHPFTICTFPYIDGKITGYLTDAIDHNIAMNRAVVLHDWLLRVQAKGVTVVPKAIIPEGTSMEQFANSWTSVGDMVFIDMKPEQKDLMPRTFFGAAQNFDVSGLIATYQRLMDSGSPVNGALQGKTPTSGTSGTLYYQMTNNAATPIAALMDDFHSFVETLLYKKLKNIAKFYTPERWREIAGRVDTMYDLTQLDLNKVEDIEFDLRLKESSSSPVLRETQEQDLLFFLEKGFISFEQFLQTSSKPYADKLLQLRQSQGGQEEQNQTMPSGGGIPGGAVPETAPVSEAPPSVGQPAYQPKPVLRAAGVP